jgi:hypothetical protein
MRRGVRGRDRPATRSAVRLAAAVAVAVASWDCEPRPPEFAGRQTMKTRWNDYRNSAWRTLRLCGSATPHNRPNAVEMANTRMIPSWRNEPTRLRKRALAPSSRKCEATLVHHTRGSSHWAEALRNAHNRTKCCTKRSSSRVCVATGVVLRAAPFPGSSAAQPSANDDGRGRGKRAPGY